MSYFCGGDIPDPIEQAEASAERQYFDALQPDGKLKCYQCDNVFDEKNGVTISAHPYAPLVCPECLRAEIESYDLIPKNP